MIRCTDLWHSYGTTPTLRGVDLHVADGELLCVMGPNGMGKSTLLGIVGGVLPPLEGRVEIDGRTRRGSVEDEQHIRRRTVYLPDEPWLPPERTGRQWLVSVGRLYGVPAQTLFERVEQLLEVFDLADRGDAAISSYSTGQRKKIGLCGAFVTEAPVLILDEPMSGGLDASALLAVEQVLKHLASQPGRTVLMAVPVPELVDRLADRVAVMHRGEILKTVSPDELCRDTGRDNLAEALEHLTHPEGRDAVRRYLAGRGEGDSGSGPR